MGRKCWQGKVSLLCRMLREGLIEMIFRDLEGGVVRASGVGGGWRGEKGHM